MKTVKIKEFDPDKIEPTSRNYMNPDSTGSKIVVIGKPGTGKTTLLTGLLYEKKHIFPVAQIYSGTEDSNSFYSKRFAPLLIYPSYDEENMVRSIKRQKLAKKHVVNPWAVYLLDDVTDDTAKLRTPVFQSIFKNGRHWKCLFILSFNRAL